MSPLPTSLSYLSNWKHTQIVYWINVQRCPALLCSFLRELWDRLNSLPETPLSEKTGNGGEYTTSLWSFTLSAQMYLFLSTAEHRKKCFQVHLTSVFFYLWASPDFRGIDFICSIRKPVVGQQLKLCSPLGENLWHVYCPGCVASFNHFVMRSPHPLLSYLSTVPYFKIWPRPLQAYIPCWV